MPYTATDHQESKPIEMANFTGGINSSVPPTQIADNECSVIQNMFLDKSGGRLRTRYPILKYSNSAAPAALYGIWYWKGVWILATTDRKVYYLDSSKDPQYLGELNGASRPCFCPYNNRLFIASGGQTQYISISGTTPQPIVNVTAALLASYIMEKDTRLVTAGDSDFPDRVRQGTYADDTIWDPADYGDPGLFDDTTVVGIAEAFEGCWIIFKRGYGGLKTFYMTTLATPPARAYLAVDGHSVRSHAGIVQALSKVFVMEEHCISSLVGTDSFGKIIYDQNPGLKLSNAFKATAACFGIHYPRDAQIWFVPDPTKSEMYIYHYHLNAWTKFSFGSRKPYSAFYDPVADYMYLGCDDGYIYKYDYDSMAYADTSGSYTSRFLTKMFAQGNREMVLKFLRMVWTTLKAGSGTMKVLTDYGQTSTTWSTITTTDPQEYVYDTQEGAELIANKDMELDSNWTASAGLTNSRSNTQAHGGTYSWKITTTTTPYGGIQSDDFTTVTGHTYGYEVWVYSAATTVRIAAYQGVGGNTLALTTQTPTIVASTWTKVSGTWTETAGGTSANLYLGADGTATIWYFDDASVKDITDAVYVYDTQAGGTVETYVFPETVYEEQKGDYNQPTESFQFDIALTSGGFMVERLAAEIASSRRV